MTLPKNICVENNVKIPDYEFVYPPRGPSSQCREAGYQFSLVIYDKEFNIRSLVTAGVPGGVHTYQGTGASSNQSHVMDQINDNVVFTNHWSSHGDLWGPIVHINQDIYELSHGFYI